MCLASNLSKSVPGRLPLLSTDAPSCHSRCLHSHVHRPTAPGMGLNSDHPLLPSQLTHWFLPPCLTFSHSLLNSLAWQALTHFSRPRSRSSQIRSPCEYPQLKLTTASSVPHRMLQFCHPWLFQYFIPSTRLQAPKSRTISYIFYPSKPSTDSGTWIPTKMYWIREMQVAKCKVGHKNSIQIKCHSGSEGRKSKSS